MAANHRYVVIGKNLQIGRTFGLRSVGEGGLLVYDRQLKKKLSSGNTLLYSLHHLENLAS
jgi:hypothetical protein